MWIKFFIIFSVIGVMAMIFYSGFSFSSIFNPLKSLKSSGQNPSFSGYFNDYILPPAKDLAEKTKKVLTDSLALTESSDLSFETAKNEIADDVESKISLAVGSIAENIDLLEKSAKKKMIENVIEQMLGKLSPEDKKIAGEAVCQYLK